MTKKEVKRREDLITLIEGIASKSAKRRLLKVWRNERYSDGMKVLESFYIGYSEGKNDSENTPL